MWSKPTKKILNSLVLICLLSFSNLLHANTLLDRIVAVVNDDIILLSELNEQSDQALAELRQRQIQRPNMNVLRERVLDNIIMQKLQEQRAKQRGIQVSDEEINAQLSQMAEANNLTLLQLREALNQQMPNGFSTIRKQISDQILIQKLREIEIISQIQVSEGEVDNFIQRRQLQDSNEEFKLAHILITRPDSPTAEQSREVEQKVKDIYQQLLDGEEFAQMAVRHSEASQALNGGDLGWLNLDEMPSFFTDTVSALQLGQISQIIETPSGYHILKLNDKRRGENQGQALEQEAIQAIRSRKANETFDLWMRRLRDEAYVETRLEQP
ncbi:peptidylprolyl isomerase [Thiomicrospira pelophila]|uniref:peptidylprolyl isomerase n=1 Tax=Thiomicrospira pelophila TaxID=934 RepID=UPI0004A6E8F1|nr:peptidylprolyl isomerase [Thiomicrospira pelophila]